MVARDTGTGWVLEKMVLASLEHGGYRYQTQVHIGNRLGGGRHMVDVLAEDKQGNKIIISLKWQQVSGTAEQKVPFEAMCLAEAILTNEDLYQKAYLVLGGEGWKLRDFFIDGGLNSHLRHGKLVNIVTLENFVARSNQGAL